MDLRLFSVRARQLEGHHARLLKEASFEAAAVAYLEDFGPAVGAGDTEDISVIVRDVGTGHEHCFRIEPFTGSAERCG